ncbi:MAG: methyltransferase domain-containing protein [Anaerolineae bacterium]|nr:methyltransferase domain-containing protein [Anaerolineae bacterium]MCO5204061.1 methyltransferase domain-containing protein [Anaerolineae bacterium]
MANKSKLDWRRRFVKAIYATHNDSPQIRAALSHLLETLDQDDICINVGSGGTVLHPRMINIDLFAGATINCNARAEQLPFVDNSVRLIVTQEVLEHVQGAQEAAKEMYRALQPNGILYCQVPFVIGYHPGPTDYWRFSKEGIRELIEAAGFQCDEVAVAVGPATGYYRIAVEFASVLVSLPQPRAYHLLKGLFALLFYPVKWLDPVMMKSAQVDRIAGGYYVIARKTG